MKQKIRGIESPTGCSQMELTAKLYTIIMLAGFSLFYRNAYFDILRAKRDFYLVVTGVFCLLMVLFLILFQFHLKNKKNNSIKICSGIREIKGIDRWMGGGFLLLAVTGGIGLLGEEHRADAFLGLTGRYLGVLALLLGIVSAVFLALYVTWDHWCGLALLFGTGVVFLLQILNQFDIDPLGMYEQIAATQKGLFSSTIGNVNFNATYDCMAVGVLMVLFVLCKNKLSMVLYGSWLFLGFIAMFNCRSDSVFLGIAAGFLVLLLFGCVHPQKLWRVWMVFAIFWSSICMMSFLYYIVRKQVYVLTKLLYPLIRVRSLLYGGVALAVLLLVVWGISRMKKQAARHLVKLYAGVLALLFFGGLAVFVAANVSEAPASWLSPLVITDTWGSSRGYVWQRSWSIFGEYSLWNKLFGCGMNLFSYVLADLYQIEMSSTLGVVFIDAHNEFLQMLASTGIVGVIGYFGTQLALFTDGIRQLKNRENVLFTVMGIAVFWAQGLVNNSQIVTMPILFLQLGLFWGLLRKKE